MLPSWIDMIDDITPFRVLLLSPYDAMSHRYWREGLKNTFTEYEWVELTLPPRYFNWRIRSWGRQKGR